MGKHSHHERRRLYTWEGVNVISRTDLREKIEIKKIEEQTVERKTSSQSYFHCLSKLGPE
jgi:hypothetical protein